MKKRKKLCVACEIADKEVKATKECDGLSLCDRHYLIYTKQLDSIIHEKSTD